MPLSRIKPQMESSQLRLDSSAASTDVNERVLLNGVDSSSTGDGYAVLLEDATANADFSFTSLYNVMGSAVSGAGDAPHFHVGLRANSGAISSATYTKVGMDRVVVDTHGYFDTANNRYLPLIAGYYLISVSIRQEGANNTYVQSTVYKNGLIQAGNAVSDGGGGLQYTTPYTQSVIHLNGSTDYVEAWGYTSHSSGTGIWGYVNNTTRMDGFLLKRTS